MPDREQRLDREQGIVIRWRTRNQADSLIPTFDNAYPIEEEPYFDDVLKAIDEAERQVWGDAGTDDDQPD